MPEQTKGESEKERVDRELIELLNELRVALPGVQVLFAFMLTVPFSSGFNRINQAQRLAFFVSFMLTALAIGLLIAPTSYHRLRFRHGDKRRMLFTSNRLAVTGLALVALATAGVTYVITDLLFGTGVAAWTAAAVAGWLAWFWYGLPVSRRIADQGTGPDPPTG